MVGQIVAPHAGPLKEGSPALWAHIPQRKRASGRSFGSPRCL